MEQFLLTEQQRSTLPCVSRTLSRPAGARRSRNKEDLSAPHPQGVPVTDLFAKLGSLAPDAYEELGKVSLSWLRNQNNELKSCCLFIWMAGKLFLIPPLMADLIRFRACKLSFRNCHQLYDFSDITKVLFNSAIGTKQNKSKSCSTEQPLCVSVLLKAQSSLM